jgi:hypothetical protein
MKLEILIKRLALKTNTPELEKVLLGQADIRTLPMECMLWTGAKLGGHTRQRTSKSARDGLTIDIIQDEKAYGVVRWQTKTISVQRLIFLLAMKPDFEFRMWSNCEVPLCVNPLHYDVKSLEIEPPPPDPTIFMGIDEDAWTEEEVEEVLDALLASSEPKSWKDIMAFPDLADAPEDLLRKVLRRLNKGHLT